MEYSMIKNLVSVIVTTHKREPKMLKRALDSVVNQTYKNIEIIVVDDSPEDYEFRPKIKELVTGYENTIYIAHGNNKGAAISRNDGIAVSKGEFLAFLDDDDEWLPEKTEKQISLMSSDVGLVYCREYIVDSATGQKTINSRDYHTGKVFKYLITDNFIGGNSFVLIRRSAIENCGNFADIKSAQDAELFLRISRKYKVAYVDEPLLNYYINHGERITHNHYNKIDGFTYIDKKYRWYLFFHPIKKAKRLSKLLIPYSATNNKKYIKTIIKIMLLTPHRIKQNYYFCFEIKKALKK